MAPFKRVRDIYITYSIFSMMNQINIIRAFSDNFIYLYQYDKNNVIAIDTGDSKPVLKELEKNSLSLIAILLTHHHSDHTGGISELKKKTGCKIIGPDGKRINDIDEIVEDKQSLIFGDINIEVIATPGHTTTSVCYYIPSSAYCVQRTDFDELSRVADSENLYAPRSTLNASTGGTLFTGDTLFIGGCGRLFECNAETMWNSLQKLAALPDDTKVYPGHDYTLENYEFALQEEPNNSLILKRIAEIKQGKPTIPSTIAQEKETNIFLKANSPEIFAELRRLKDKF